MPVIQLINTLAKVKMHGVLSKKQILHELCRLFILRMIKFISHQNSNPSTWISCRALCSLRRICFTFSRSSWFSILELFISLRCSSSSLVMPCVRFAERILRLSLSWSNSGIEYWENYHNVHLFRYII